MSKLFGQFAALLIFISIALCLRRRRRGQRAWLTANGAACIS